MNATDAVAALLRAVPDGLFVSSLGTATSALRKASDDDPHLYMGGSMGTALAVAIGVAEKRPAAHVVAVMGDGEAVMGGNSLWSLAGIRPPNLLVAVLADGRYSITGMQSLGAPPVFAAVTSALGLSSTVVSSPQEVEESARTIVRPALIEIRYSEHEWPGPSPFVDPPVVRWRFEEAAAKHG